MIKKYLSIFNFINNLYENIVKLFNQGITFLSVVPYFYILYF